MRKKFSCFSFLASSFFLVSLLFNQYVLANQTSITSNTQWENGQALTTPNNAQNGAIQPAVSAAPDGKTVIVAYMHKTGSLDNQADPYYFRSTQNGKPNTWSGPSPIYTSGADSRFVDVTFDASNKAHAVWVEGNNQLWYGKEDDWGSSNPKNIYSGDLFIEAPRIASSGNNTLNLVWSQQDFTTDFNIFYARSTDGGSIWKDLFNISESSGSSKIPAIAVDSSNYLHVVWEEQVFGSEYEILYRNSENGGIDWSPPITISEAIDVGTSLRAMHQPEIVISGNTLYVAFENRPAENEQKAYLVSCNSSDCTNINQWSGTDITVQNYSIKNTDPAFLKPQPALLGGCTMVLFGGITGTPSPTNNERIRESSSCNNWSSNPTVGGVDAVMGSNVRAIRPSVTTHNSWWLYLAFERKESRSDIYFVRNIPALYLPVIIKQ
ncbi:MAG: exo-alpha-sialidase [Chloroflexi bacterium]|nr:exo-alpha-sialidase [Chloroflexota bacterium]